MTLAHQRTETRLPRVGLSASHHVRALELISDARPNSELAMKYAAFKLGAPGAREELLQRLARLMIEDLGERLHRFDWYLATPATMELVQEFHQVLGQSIDVSRNKLLSVGPPPHPDSDYSGCDQEERLQRVDSFFDIRQPLPNGRVLMIDDFLNTGTALTTLSTRLVNLGAIELHAFVFIRGVFRDPTHERKMVSEEIERMPLVEILRILTHPRHYVTSATMLKYLERRTAEELVQVRQVMSAEQVVRLRRNIRFYYRDHVLPSNLEQF